MSVPGVAVVCRTVVVTAYLLALLVAGRPGWGAAIAAPALVAVWLAPLVVGHGRARTASLGPAGPGHRPAGGSAGGVSAAPAQVSCAMASMPSQMPKRKKRAEAP
jgi:hypothetical protein